MNPTLKTIILNKFITLNNLVTDGNFPSGDNWDPTNGTENVTNNTYILTGNGTFATPRVNTTISANIVGHIYWIRGRVRVTNSNCNYINVAFDEFYVSTTNAPTINVWYPVSVLRTATSTSVNFRIYNNYADSATANGKAMEVQEVEVADLTKDYCNGIVGTGREPTATQMNMWFPNWINGSIKTIAR